MKPYLLDCLAIAGGAGLLCALPWPAGAADAPATPTAPAAAPAPTTEPLPPLDPNVRRFVILKFDDLRATTSKTGVHWKFQRLADYLAERKMKAGFGVIANSLETAGDATIAWIKERAIENGGLFEFWHHGYDHGMGFDLNGTRCIAEFSGPPYEYQSEHFAKACTLLREKTGLTFRTFGSAGNATDANGLRVLEEHPEVKVWFFADPKVTTTKCVLKRVLNLEHAVGRVSCDTFLTKYRWQRGKNEYLALQAHPGMWSDESYAEFQKIVDLLAADKWEFTTAYEYYQYARDKGK